MTPPDAPPPDLLLEHAAFVRAVARATLKGDDLVDDVAQDTFVAALEGRSRPRGSLRGWLAGIARRRAADAVRRESSRRRREGAVARTATSRATADLAARAELGRRLVSAVLSLDEPYRTAILLRYYDGLPPREIAARQGLPVETVRTHVKRGIRRLRERLDERERGRRSSWRAVVAPLVVLDGPAAAVGGSLLVKKFLLGACVAALLVLGITWGTGAFDAMPTEEPPAPPTERAHRPAPSVPTLAGTEHARAPEPPAAGAPEPAALPERFRGVVVGPEGRGIEGAVVFVDEASHRAVVLSEPPPTGVPPAVTDAEGRFGLSAPATVPSVPVRVRAPGWVLPGDFGPTVGRDGETKIALVPAVRLRVRVVDAATGRGVPNALVRALTGTWAVAYIVKHFWAIDRTRADDDGWTELHVPGGPIRLMVAADGYAPRLIDGTFAQGEDTEVRVDLSAGGILEGRLVDSEGTGVVGARIRAVGPAAYESTATSMRDGAFRFDHVPQALPGLPDVPPRKWVMLEVMATGYPVQWHPESCPRAGATRTCTLALRPGFPLSGKVRRADGEDVKARWIELTVLGYGVQHGYASSPTDRTRIAADGTFRFDRIPAGRTTLHVAEPGGLAKKEPFEMPAGGHPDILQIVLGEEAVGSVTIQVVDAEDRPVSGVRVDAWPRTVESHHLYRVPGAPGRVTDADGRITFHGLPVGRTPVLVDPPGYAPLAPKVVVEVESSPPVVVRLGDGEIRGKATHLDGRPARVRLLLAVHVRGDRGGVTLPSDCTAVETKADGSFRFRGLGDEIYDIQVARGQGETLHVLNWHDPVVVGDQDARVIVATLAETASLHVRARVLDARTREPVTGVTHLKLYPQSAPGTWLGMWPVGDEPGLYRTSRGEAPGIYTVKVEANGYEDGEVEFRLRYGEPNDPALLLLEPKN